MDITRTSVQSGRTRTMDLDITPEELARYQRGGLVIQDAFPRLSDSEREFFKTGITDDEWNKLFPEEHDDRCGTRRGHPCNCALAALRKPEEAPEGEDYRFERE